LLQTNTSRQTDPGNIKILHRYMNVGIGSEAVQFSFLGIHKSDFHYSVDLLADGRGGLVDGYPAPGSSASAISGLNLISVWITS
jgi:hypothetical protein